MTLRPFILSLLTFTTLSATAQESPCPLPSEGPVQNLIFVAKPTEENCRLAQDLVDTLDQVRRTFLMAPPVTLVIGEQAGNASFDNGHIIRIPQHLVFSDAQGGTYQANTEQLKTVVVHEYGHAILKEIWAQDFNEEFGELFTGLEEISTIAETNLELKISSRAVRQMSAQLANSDAYSLYFKTLPAYSELYADALAVIFFDDPAVMYKALYYPQIPANKEVYIEPRNFAHEHSAEQLHAHPDEHTKLSLVRSFIGKNMPANPEQKRHLMKRLERAMTLAIRDELSTTSTPSLEEANTRLLHYFLEQNP
ncbi:hypothetical protein EZJ49_12150 [Bdellovibrio bacteriovorus]|uniref:hypothetical protein n=1 Tax=Bdellovibrio bacteriovorus TaxID=959 RepID=UPI0021D0E1A7|nr:hypothetical protein [Bdellovibrio bacteriovorus]UXR63814.1 hypothetical protein EZJ49_12150 [Bdellovibrio bacteriovorus]